tara:strand:+ start:378 stop:2864 length:2487 start_codon:yes stop_codon:yes gene_type:complete
MALDFEQFKEFLEEIDDDQIAKLAPLFDAANRSATDFTQTLGEQGKQLKAIKEQERDLAKLLREKEALESRGIEISAEHQKEIDRLQASVGQYADNQKRLNELQKTGQILLDKYGGGLDKAFGSLSGFTSKFTDLVGEFDEAGTKLGQTTGYVYAFQDAMTDAASGTNGLSVSMAQAGAAIGSLSTNMTLFNTLSAVNVQRITDVTLAMEKLGVDAASTAQALDTMTRGMGMSVTSATDAARSFDQLAQSVGLPTSEVIDGFNTISGDLARFGKQGKKVFGGLVKEARSMGMSIKEAFDIAEAFDTFESAAELAGKLNAQIGLQLNSVDMMNASHEDRIKMLRDEFKMRGKNFDDMSRRQRQAIAEVMGVDVDMASRLFGDPVALRKYQKEQKSLEERAKAVTTVTEDLKNMFEDIMLALGPVVKGFRNFVKLLTGNIYGKIVLFTAILAKMSGGFGNLAKGISGVVKSPLKTITGQFQKFFSAGEKASEAGQGMADGLNKTGDAAKASFKSMAGMALVIVAIGAGIGMAAAGVGYLVQSFKDLGDNAPYAVLGILAFGAAVAGIIFALAGLGPVGLAAAAVIGVIGAAAVAMGFGVKLAAEGISLMVTSLKGLTDGQGMEMAKSLAAISGGVVLMGIAGATSSIPILALSGALLALGGALGIAGPILERFANIFVSGLSSLGDVAKGIGTMFSTLGSLGAIELVKIAGGFSKLTATIIDMMENIDVDKSKALTNVLAAIGEAGVGIEKIKASAESLNALERVIKVSSDLDMETGSQVRLATQGATAAGVPSAGANYTIPITFKVNNTDLEKYVIKIVDKKFDITRID